VLVGNVDGSLWTELLPPERGPDGSPVVSATSPDTISSTVRMAGAPWLVRVQQPASVALEPATTLVRRLALLAIVAVLIGAALAWWIILRFTAPLDELASTSDALAHGDYSRRIARATARDEVGRAAIAFNTMAAQIESHHRDLESQVRERTAELERALEDLHAAQREIVRTEKLAMLGQLAGGVGHELRNPLGVMTNSLYVLETVLPEPGEMVRDYFGILKNQIALCEKIVADLLDFARTKHPARTPVALSAIARQQLGRLGLLGRVEIGEDVPDTLPLVNVDAVQIGQVVFNLLTNAVQAMGERGGALRLRGFRDGNGRAVLEVTDSGPGIPDEVAARLFEPLFTTKTKGLGLGLCVSRTLAEGNGGSLTFRTQVGVGTTFALSLPVVPHA
jgi:signal transduction histidine kinase